MNGVDTSEITLSPCCVYCSMFAQSECWGSGSLNILSHFTFTYRSTAWTLKQQLKLPMFFTWPALPPVSGDEVCVSLFHFCVESFTVETRWQRELTADPWTPRHFFTTTFPVFNGTKIFLFNEIQRSLEVCLPLNWEHRWSYNCIGVMTEYFCTCWP